MVLLESTTSDINFDYDDFVVMLKLKANSKHKLFIEALNKDEEDAHSKAYEYYEKAAIAARDQKSSNKSTILCDYAVKCLQVYGETYSSINPEVSEIMTEFPYEDFINTLTEYVSNSHTYENIKLAVNMDDDPYDLAEEFTEDIYQEFIEEEILDNIEEDDDIKEVCSELVKEGDYINNILDDLNNSYKISEYVDKQNAQWDKDNKQMENDYWRSRL